MSSVTAVTLKHWAKGHLLDILWGLYGRIIVNPALPEDPKSILFVCKGNICRSPFAERITTGLLRQRAMHPLLARSAGLVVPLPELPPEEAKQAAGHFGISLEDHISSSIRADDMELFDMILAVEMNHINVLKRKFPEFREKFFLLPLFDEKPTKPWRGYLDYNIPDPYGKDVDHFISCYSRIVRCVNNLLNAIDNSKTGAT